jgi:hypothetical protein
MKAVGSAALLLLAAGAHGQVWHVENFDGPNAAAWTFGAPTEVIEPTGGFWGSGAYLRGTGLVTATPLLRTGTSGTPFTGNYRAAGIATIAVALRVQLSAALVTSWHPTVMLVSFAGTPADPSDDWGVYRVGGDTLAAQGTWRLFTFMVPSAQTTMPGGWTFIALGPNAPAGPDWNALCQAVDRLAFSLDDPATAHDSQAWELGADYILISNRPNCYPNCDDSTVMPCLNVQDFSCFLNKFAAGDPWANCDGSTVVPWLNVQDFGCFLMSYANGCFGC